MQGDLRIAAGKINGLVWTWIHFFGSTEGVVVAPRQNPRERAGDGGLSLRPGAVKQGLPLQLGKPRL